MIPVRYRIAPSIIAGAGKGLFFEQPVARGRILVASDARLVRSTAQLRGALQR